MVCFSLSRIKQNEGTPLKPKKDEYYVEDYYEFSSLIGGRIIPDVDISMSLDVETLSTNISVDVTIEIIN